MGVIKKKTGAVLVFAAIALLLAGSVYGEDLYRNGRNNNSRITPKTGYGGCINPGAGSYYNYAGRNNTAIPMFDGFLRYMIKRNQYGDRGQYHYYGNRNWDKDRRPDGTRGRYDNNSQDRYDRYNRGYYNWH